MPVLPVPLEVTAIPVSGGNLTLVAIVGVIALLALVMAVIFRREVLAAREGTENMQDDRARRPGGCRGITSAASSARLSVFAVVAFFLLLALPVRGRR